MTYLNLISETNASIESVPGTSQPHRNISCVQHVEINYIMSHHNVWFFLNNEFHVASLNRRVFALKTLVGAILPGWHEC